MATPDELLANVRRAIDRYVAAPADSSEESVAAVGSLAAFCRLDEHLKAGGLLPAEWDPRSGWDVVIQFPATDAAQSALAQIQADHAYGGCKVAPRGGFWEVTIPLAGRQGAEETADMLREQYGWRPLTRTVAR